MTNYIQQCRAEGCQNYIDGHGPDRCSEHPRILVPPGIGDIYWVLVKLPALMKLYGWKKPELTILSNPDERGGHLRAIPYLQMFDWLDIGDPQTVPNKPELQAVYDEAYSGLLPPLFGARSLFENIQGYDYFIAYNGRVNSGDYIENDYVPCDWYPKMTAQTEQIIDIQARNTKLIDCAVMFWPFYGSYESHLAQFSLDNIVRALREFVSNHGLVPVFVGSQWDAELNPRVRELIANIPNSVDLIGKTELVSLFGILKAAKIVLGYHAGITQMAAVFGTKTLLLWDDRYPASTSYAVVPPETRGRNYIPLETKGLTIDTYVDTMEALYASKY